MQLPSDAEEIERYAKHAAVDGVRFPNGDYGWHHRIDAPHGDMLARVDDNDELTLVQVYHHVLSRDSSNYLAAMLMRARSR